MKRLPVHKLALAAVFCLLTSGALQAATAYTDSLDANRNRLFAEWAAPGSDRRLSGFGKNLNCTANAPGSSGRPLRHRQLRRPVPRRRQPALSLHGRLPLVRHGYANYDTDGCDTCKSGYNKAGFSDGTGRMIYARQHPHLEGYFAGPDY